MKLFLDKHSLRRYTIAELFLRERQTWTVSEIAARLDLDNRTVVKDIATLQTDFLNWPDIVFSTHQNGTSFTLNYAADFDQNKILFYFLEQSIPFLFILELLTAQAVNPLEFADKHFISRATFYRHLTTAKAILKTFNLQISSPPFTLTGNEEQIRFFYYFFFNSFDDDRFWSYFPINKNDIVILLNNVEKIMNFQIIEYNRQSLIKLLTIHKYRMLGKHYAPEHHSNSMYPLCDEDGIYSFSVATMTKFLRQTQLPEKICYNESICILAAVISLAFFEQTESITNAVLDYNYRFNSPGIQLTDKTIELWQQYFILPQAEVPKLLKANLLCVYFFVINYSINISYFEPDELDNNISNEHKDNIIKCSKAIIDFAKTILPRTNYQHIVDSETYIIYSLTKILLPIINHKKMRPTIKVYAVCSKGYYQNQYLKTYLIDHFAFNLEFTTYPVDADIIITDTELVGHIINEATTIFNYQYPILSEVDTLRLQKTLTDLERKL